MVGSQAGQTRFLTLILSSSPPPPKTRGLRKTQIHTQPMLPERGTQAGAVRASLPPDLGHSRLLGNAYLQSRKCLRPPYWALTLYDSVKEPGWRWPPGTQDLGWGCRSWASGRLNTPRPGAGGDPLAPTGAAVPGGPSRTGTHLSAC